MAKQKKDPKKPLHVAFKFSQYDTQHRRQILQAAHKVEQLYNAAIQQVANRAASMIGDEDPASEFRWQDFPSLNKAAEELLDKLEQGLQTTLESTMRDAWDLANAKNAAFVTYLARLTPIPESLLNEWRQPNLTALETLTRRISRGMNLSNGSGERTGVWNLAQFKEELELTLQVCMGKGMSAAEMARKVKQYLKYPDKLFRRVRDEHGVLRLSKAAKAFHPGPGVYRSSYKNALRLTATENNIAYRTADHERWQQMDFVLGQHVHLSQNHTLNGKPFVDICDELSGSATDMDDPRGRYPKDFKFVGWHPFCRCYVTPIMVSQEEMAAWAEARRKGESYEFKEKPITEMPAEFAEKMRGMDERIAKAEERGKLPYFMRDNPERMAQVLGRPIVVKAGEPVATKQLTHAQQAATIRHANRTADEVADIKRRAKERQELHQRIKDDAMETLATAKRKRVRLNGLEQAIADGNLDAMRGYADGLRLRIQAHNEQVQKAWEEHNAIVSDALRRLAIHPKADMSEIIPNKRAALAILKSFPNVDIEITEHKYVKNEKNPEYKINGVIGDRKGIESEKGISSGFYRAKLQSAKIVVIDLDWAYTRNYKFLRTKKLARAINHRCEDFTSGDITECYVVYKGKAARITTKSIVGKQPRDSVAEIADILEKIKE